MRSRDRAADEDQGEPSGCLTATARFVVRHPKKILFGYVAVAIWPGFFIRSEFNAAFLWAFQYLSAPILLGLGGLGWARRRIFLAAGDRPAAYWASLFVWPPFAVLLSGGLALQANALLPPQRDVLIEGVVAGRSISGTRSKSWIVDVECGGRVRRLEVSRQTYEQSRVGERFSQSWREGPLGFCYVWR